MTPQVFTRSRRLLAIVGVAVATLVALAAPVHAKELGESCSNPDAGYSVGVPTGWHANERVDGGGSDDVAACRFFSPEPFVVVAASQATDIAVAVGVQEDGPHASGEQTTVGGRPAARMESVAQDGGFEPAGTRTYSYWIELGDGSWLVASTSDGPNWVGDYEENRAILDAMMESLTFQGSMLPDTGIRVPSSRISPPFVGGGVVLIAAWLAACRLRAWRPAR